MSPLSWALQASRKTPGCIAVRLTNGRASTLGLERVRQFDALCLGNRYRSGSRRDLDPSVSRGLNTQIFT